MIDAIVNVNLSLFELAVADASEEEMYELVDEAVQLTSNLKDQWILRRKRRRKNQSSNNWHYHGLDIS